MTPTSDPAEQKQGLGWTLGGSSRSRASIWVAPRLAGEPLRVHSLLHRQELEGLSVAQHAGALRRGARTWASLSGAPVWGPMWWEPLCVPSRRGGGGQAARQEPLSRQCAHVWVIVCPAGA